ncbi:MAG TPA: DUF4416 family protein [Candidatus Binatia bacterium]|jgi:hypothetical protein
MGTAREPKPVKLFVALLAAEENFFPPVENDLGALFGPVESASRVFRWAVTNYYEREMGSGLFRRFLSFGPLIAPEALAEIKHQTRSIEDGYQRAEGAGRRRRVNIDPGYLDAGKVVLASTKDAAHRIYLRAGIYAELTLLYYDGAFHPFGYTYPDYLWPETAEFLAALRSRYLEQLKQNGPGLL